MPKNYKVLEARFGFLGIACCSLVYLKKKLKQPMQRRAKAGRGLKNYQVCM